MENTFIPLNPLFQTCRRPEGPQFLNSMFVFFWSVCLFVLISIYTPEWPLVVRICQHLPTQKLPTQHLPTQQLPHRTVAHRQQLTTNNNCPLATTAHRGNCPPATYSINIAPPTANQQMSSLP